jgi:hypothetical protein
MGTDSEALSTGPHRAAEGSKLLDVGLRAGCHRDRFQAASPTYCHRLSGWTAPMRTRCRAVLWSPRWSAARG